VVSEKALVQMGVASEQTMEIVRVRERRTATLLPAMTTEQYAERDAAREKYENWINMACARAESGEVDRPEPQTVYLSDRLKEQEWRRL